MQLTRRQFAGLALGVGGLGLTACGRSDTSSDKGSSTAGFPVRLTHRFGHTTIPRKPKRVVAVGGGDMETAIALGIVPVAGADWFGWTTGMGDLGPERRETAGIVCHGAVAVRENRRGESGSDFVREFTERPVRIQQAEGNRADRRRAVQREECLRRALAGDMPLFARGRDRRVGTLPQC